MLAMPRIPHRYLTALPAFALVAIAALLTIGPERTEAHHLCGNTGSPFGPFDLQTYEAGDYRTSYPRAMDLAGFNQLFPDRPSFALPALEGVQPWPYIPPVLLKSIAWIESGWSQGSYDPLVKYGEVGPVLSSHDCGYGIMQVTSGMQNVTGVPTLDQAMIGGHYAFNIARGARILADKWNLAPEYRPYVGSRNSQIIEDWYYALWAYNGFAFKNHPLNPDYAWPRPMYDCSSARTYPYQELIMGCAANPPWRAGSQLWSPQPVHLPDLADPNFAGPLRLEHWGWCSQSLQCAPMNMPTASPWNVDPTGPAVPRDQLLGAPHIGLSTANVVLGVIPGGQSPPANIDVSNLGSGVLSWRATTTASWLRLSRVQGVSLGGDLGARNSSFSVQADTTGLYPGTYVAQVVLESHYAGGVPAIVNVTLRFGDGAVVRLPDGRTYLLQGGLKRYIPDPVTFEAYGFTWAGVIAVPDHWAGSVPSGDNLPGVLANGRLIHPAGGSAIYVMEGGAKRQIASPSLMAQCAYYDGIASISGTTANSIPNGPQLTAPPCPGPSFPTRTLLQSADGRVWLIQGGVRRWILGPHVFPDCAYEWGNLNALGDSLVGRHPIGPNVTGCSNDGSLLMTEDGSVNVVAGGLVRRIPDPATFETNSFDWTRVTAVGAMALPRGDPLLSVLANGRLVSAAGAVYVMEGAAKRHVTAPDIFTACGYHGGAIAGLSPETLGAIPSGPPVSAPPCPKFVPPAGTLLKGSDGAVWVTLAPYRKWMTHLGALSDCGYRLGNANTVPDGVLAGLPPAAAVSGCSVDGSLLRTPDGGLYAVRGRLRRHLPNAPTLEANGLSWGHITPVPDGWLPAGRPLPDVVATGRLVRSPQGAVYVMQSGAKRYLTGPDAMAACAYGWDAATGLSEATVATIPDGSPISGPPCPQPTFPNGTLLISSDGAIWAVQSGQRRWITGPDVFAGCGYAWANVDRIADSVIAALPMGPNLASAPCP